MPLPRFALYVRNIRNKREDTSENDPKIERRTAGRVLSSFLCPSHTMLPRRVFSILIILTPAFVCFTGLIAMEPAHAVEPSDRRSLTAARDDALRVEEGRILYRKLCSKCHGANGTPSTEITALLEPAPTDLTRLPYRYGSSISDISDSIRRGRGTNMFRFDNRIADEQIEAISLYIKQRLQIEPQPRSPN